MAAELAFLVVLAVWLGWLVAWWLRARHLGGLLLAVVRVAVGWLWLTAAATLVVRLLDLFLGDLAVGPSAGLLWTIERGLMVCGVVAAVMLASAAARRVRR